MASQRKLLVIDGEWKTPTPEEQERSRDVRRIWRSVRTVLSKWGPP